MMFLQAAGMAAQTVRELEAKLEDAKGLSSEQRTIVQFARRVTEAPGQITDREIAAFRQAAGSDGDFIEATYVIGQFNFITRVADALGVDLELPKPLRRFGFTRHLALGLMSRLVGSAVDLRSREIAAPEPGVTLKRLDRLFVETLGFSKRPASYEPMAARPYLLEAEWRMAEAFLTKGELARAVMMEIGTLVAKLTGNAEMLELCTQWLEKSRVSAAPVGQLAEGNDGAGLERGTAAMLRFARDETLHAYKITEERVDELRCVGVADAQILELASVTALFNAYSRRDLILARPAEPARESMVSHGASL